LKIRAKPSEYPSLLPTSIDTLIVKVLVPSPFRTFVTEFKVELWHAKLYADSSINDNNNTILFIVINSYMQLICYDQKNAKI
jgi:hypothetical protein